MNRTSIIWLGVILLIALCVLCLLFHAKKIETRLTENAQAALQTAGITGIDVKFDGRNAIISGAVASEELRTKSAELIQSLSGVRSVANEVTIEKPEIDVPETVEKPEVKEVKPEVNLAEVLSKLTVNFETNSFELNAQAKPVVNQILGLLKDSPDVRIKIVGHADSRGTDEYNLKLGQRRAQAVKSLLVNGGVPADRLIAISAGESKPIAGNMSEAEMGKNRRVEFVVNKEE